MPPPQHICSKRGGSPGETTVWQWNCRGYKNKHGSLIQYIATSTRPPEIIALQKTNTHVRLPGYVTYGTDTGDSFHTLVSKKPVAVQHHLQQSEPLAIMLEKGYHVRSKRLLSAEKPAIGPQTGFGTSSAHSRQPSASNSGRLQCSPSPLKLYVHQPQEKPAPQSYWRHGPHTRLPSKE
ncbi:hypothetical protein HPB49_006406 [Dermacentor silvarum]|uniref:Uncharacterized protein n=1 Tax=Dermacentor silvarum TaxID=543639 RepID=A0ACB8CW58_DERSI|nr:hypothetical protein HPB49_006406 [Dermacentor silvarum]